MARSSSSISEDAQWYVLLAQPLDASDLDANVDGTQAIYTVFLSFGSSVGAIAGGYIDANISLDWLHWMNVLLSAITFVLCLFILPETLYHREQTTITFDDDPDKATHETKERVTVTDTAASYPSYTYLKSLRLYTYHPGVLQKFLAPLKVIRLPGVWLVSGWYAGLVGLVVTMSSIGPQIVGAPPYLWGKNVGLINAGGIVGSLLGCVSCSLLLTSTALSLPTLLPHTCVLTMIPRHTRTLSPISPPSALQRRTRTASQSRNPVLLLPSHRSSLPQ